MLRTTAIPVLVVGIVGLAQPAGASIFDVYGFNARGVGMAGAVTALSSDYAATYYNPAGITQNKVLVFGGGYMLSVPALDVARTRPVCLELPDACAAMFTTGYSNRETVLPDAFSGFTLGWVFPFGGIFENRLVLALAVYMPTINVIRVEALDPQTPQFYMYQNLPDALVILSSLAYEIAPWVSVGFGFQVLANVNGAAEFNVDIMNGTFNKQDFRVEISPQAAATAGLMFKPMNNLSVGFSYRQALGLEFRLPASLKASDAIQLDLTVAGSVLYQPHQFNLGMSYSVEGSGVTVSAELGYALWSLAPDPSPDVSVDISGSLLESFGLSDALDIATDTSTSDLHFSDTWTPRVGVEWQALDWFQVRGGYYFRPSPAPTATGSSNYLDNHTHAFSVGTAFIFADPFGAHKEPITVELSHQLAWLGSRELTKSEVDDPIGDLEHGGFTYMLALTINHTY